MTETHLISKDVQSLEIPEAIVYLFELEYTSSTTLYFHPGVTPDVQVTSVSGSTIKLNKAQTFTDNAQLTFTGVNNNTLYVLQSSDDTQYDDHINCVNDADELAEQANLIDVMYAGKKLLPNGMIRFMVIGK